MAGDIVDMDSDGGEQPASQQNSQPASQQQQGEGAPGKKTGRGRKPAEFPCLCCGENCTKTQQSVRCIMCKLWAHKDCIKMSDSTFRTLEEQVKESGTAYWVCRPCQSFGQRVQHQFAENNKRHDMNEKRMDAHEKRLDNTERNMERMQEELRKMAEKISKDNGEREDKLCDEMQEREVRRMNLIIHGVDEQPEDVRGNRERIEKDKIRCELIFKAMRARTRKDDIRFCRRLGEKNNEPRPIVIGLENEEEKRHILTRARDLRGTQYCDVSIVPDLTRKQRNREAKMKEEAEEKNMTLTAEEKQRNIRWMVVGRRGEKRIIKGVDREQQNYRYQDSGPPRENHNQRAAPPTQPRDQQQQQRSPGRPPLAANSTGRKELLPDNRDRNSRWQPSTRDERELGARSKQPNDRWQENRTAGATDRRENSSRWDENGPGLRGASSKRTRGSGTASEEDDQPRSRQRN
jgi:hypothetical protein